ncbi:hypothetical protein ACFQVA_10870 [Actinomadura keratinilytica]
MIRQAAGTDHAAHVVTHVGPRRHGPRAPRVRPDRRGSGTGGPRGARDREEDIRPRRRSARAEWSAKGPSGTAFEVKEFATAPPPPWTAS